jgi:hypothetical protein
MSVEDDTALTFADMNKVLVRRAGSSRPNTDVAVALGLSERQWRRLKQAPESKAARALWKKFYRLLRESAEVPWSRSVESQLDHVGWMLDNRSTDDIRGAYSFSADIAYEHVFAIDYRPRPLVDLTERDWSQAMLAGRYYAIVAGSAGHSDEEMKRHEFVQSVFGDMLALRDDDWAYTLKVKRVVRQCLPEWNRIPPDERNCAKLRAMITAAGYFESVLGYLSWWPHDADMMFGAIAVASRFLRGDLLSQIADAVTPAGGLDFMKKTVGANRKFDNGDCDYFRTWSQKS